MEYIIGKNIVILDQVDSTNLYLANLIQNQEIDEGSVIIAKHQTAGRGADQNIWLSDKGKNLTLSILLKPSFVDIKNIFILNKFISISIAATLEHFMPEVKVQIKWPNDILVNNQKIAGILIQNSVIGHHIQYSIVGIGLNVNQTNFSDALQPSVTSMKLAKGQDYLLDDVLKELYYQVDQIYKRLKQGAWSFIEQVYLKLLYGYNKIVALEDEQGRFTGTIIGITPEGKLVVKKENGIKSYYFKEVKFLLSC